MKRPVQVGVYFLVVLVAGLGPGRGFGDAEDDPNEVGAGIIRQMIESNRDWLLSPPAGVHHYSYTFHRYNADSLPCRVPNARKAVRIKVWR